jgi:hypothetical protein
MHAQLVILAALSAAGAVYFVFLRKVFDFVSVGFFGQLIYFSPGFYGHLANPYFPGVMPSVPIIDESYYVWNACLGATLLTGILYRPANVPILPLTTSRYFDFALLGLLVMSALLALVTGGTEILSSDKNEVLNNINRFFLLFAGCCQVGVICFVLQRKWFFAILPAAGVAFLLYAGFRAEFALSVIGIAAYLARRFGILYFARPRYLVPILAAAAILVGYKPFLTADRVGNWRVLDALQTSDNLWDTIILQFEPLLTQAVLNETLLRQFQVPAVSLLHAMVALIPFLAPAIGLAPEEVSFDFQNHLFPNIPYGMTGSPEAQFIAALGWIGLLLFIVALNVLLVATSKGMESRRPARLLFALGVGAFFAFYVQRNDLANSLTLINRVGVTVFFAWLVSWVMASGRTEVSS